MSIHLFLFPGRSLAPRSITSTICAQCRRSFASSAVLNSGHNRWSKIKHEKGAADAKKNAQRSGFAKNLTLWSQLYGPDPSLNARLATVVAAAKKAGMPKASIDIAIARGQGKSSSGAGLETMTLEVMIPPAVAMVIDIATDNKQRALQDLRVIVKKHNGTVTPTAFLFARFGRVVLKGDKDDDFDEVLMEAVEAGAEDVEQDKKGNAVLHTQPNTTHQIAQNLSQALSTEILSCEIIWSPIGDKVKLDDEEAATNISTFLTALQEYPDVQGVYANVEQGEISKDLWTRIEDNLDT
ncbi:YebC-like protein [Daldinia loculata]|uniref:YebC-like protein n=1 Tax=Daldinia loculata TaxID=103429 RepID=UPI0020C4CC53|nr:YebC-like protein [Daldinia loculata]KAI1643824.1 YebC-like protein [Daldinia loculata]KAI2778695.1 YebC-like protein [Daldinia loculata]